MEQDGSMIMAVSYIVALSGHERERIAADLAEIACAAGEVLLGHHGSDCPHVLKLDGSPSSRADLEAEQLILAHLRERFPSIPIVAEETCHDVPPADRFFLVDPLDGTKDFLAGSPEFAVCIALVEGGRPVAAALAAPGVGRVWHAGVAAYEAPIEAGRPGPARAVRTRQEPTGGLTALGSRRHGDVETEVCLDALGVTERRPVGSALKFALIASGEADLYVRCGPTMEWDTAAGDHILTVAGGRVVTPAGQPVLYGRHGMAYRNGPFVALGDPSLADRVVLPDRGPIVRPRDDAALPAPSPVLRP